MRMEQYAEGYVEELSAECTKYRDLAQSLADALEWYLQNDDTNMGDPNNGFYIQGHNNAKAALANYRKGT